ncbi:MAG: hypothetical protein OXE53_17390, partial [Deltaproteobacteria bacterium]|nr:hypothetical protein [Deltaproteobacteria bacterium]
LVPMLTVCAWAVWARQNNASTVITNFVIRSSSLDGAGEWDPVLSEAGTFVNRCGGSGAAPFGLWPRIRL